MSTVSALGSDIKANADDLGMAYITPRYIDYVSFSKHNFFLYLYIQNDLWVGLHDFYHGRNFEAPFKISFGFSLI